MNVAASSGDVPSIADVVDQVGGSVGLDTNVITAGVVALAAVAAIATATGGSASATESGASAQPNRRQRRGKPNALAIPYDAPARAAYQAWLDDHTGEKWNEPAFLAFEKAFHAHAVAQATEKKLARDLATFANKPWPEPAPRPAPRPKAPEEPQTSRGGLFFASSD